MAPQNLGRLRSFIIGMTGAVDRLADDEEALIDAARGHLAALISEDDWLGDAFAKPHPQYYQQYLLHCDPLERFSLVSFVWGPGQRTPIHDHGVWGLVGMLRGAEFSQAYSQRGQALEKGERRRLEPGDIEILRPSLGDIHAVSNAYEDRVSISIHLYGANIGAVRRRVFDPQTGAEKPFVSGYASNVVPNLWG